MAEIHVTDDRIEIRLTRVERVAGLLTHQDLPLRQVTSVHVEPRPDEGITGWRAPGLAIPGRTRIGTWRARGRRVFVCVRSGVPAVRIEATGAGTYDAFLVSHPDAAAVRELIAARL